MKPDPRACRIPFDRFNHLSLAEIDEYARLRRKAKLVMLERDEAVRMADLGSRRVCIPAAPEAEGAA